MVEEGKIVAAGHNRHIGAIRYLARKESTEKRSSGALLGRSS
jgi:hypothetical protein